MHKVNITQSIGYVTLPAQYTNRGILVYLNGAIQTSGDDYVIEDTNTISFTLGLVSGDRVVVLIDSSTPPDIVSIEGYNVVVFKNSFTGVEIIFTTSCDGVPKIKIFKASTIAVEANMTSFGSGYTYTWTPTEEDVYTILMLDPDDMLIKAETINVLKPETEHTSSTVAVGQEFVFVGNAANATLKLYHEDEVILTKTMTWNNTLEYSEYTWIADRAGQIIAIITDVSGNIIGTYNISSIVRHGELL